MNIAVVVFFGAIFGICFFWLIQIILDYEILEISMNGNIKLTDKLYYLIAATGGVFVSLFLFFEYHLR